MKGVEISISHGIHVCWEVVKYESQSTGTEQAEVKGSGQDASEDREVKYATNLTTEPPSFATPHSPKYRSSVSNFFPPKSGTLTLHKPRFYYQ